MSQHSLVERFLAAMRRTGIEPDATIHADGIIRRFRDWLDKPGTRDGWYILFPDIPAAGAFGCWRRGIKVIWHDTGPVDNSLWGRNRDRIEQFLEKQHKTGRQQAEAIWNNAQPTNGRHEYLLRKRIQSHGLRYNRGALLVPVLDMSGTLYGLQRIFGDGSKRFTSGTDKIGHFFMIGSPINNMLCIAEGYATGASIHEATGNAVVVAFDAGNLLPVAKVLRVAMPDIHLLFCADNDRLVEGNPGLSKAKSAAEAVGGVVIYPRFSSIASIGSDFNDLFLEEGTGVVRGIFANGGGDYCV